jgi:hypothetical protein
VIRLQPHQPLNLGFWPQAYGQRQRNRQINVAKDIFIEVIEANPVVAERLQLSSRMPCPCVVDLNDGDRRVIHLDILVSFFCLKKHMNI